MFVMKTKLLLVSIAVGVLFLGVSHEVAAKKKGISNGTSILHFMISTAMDATDSATGQIVAKQNKQGNANNQRLHIAVSGLQPGSTYHLLASTRAETNLTAIAEFDSDAHGEAHLKFVKKNKGNASPGGEPLPGELDPLSGILALEISLGGTQTVLSADFTAPDKLQYLIMRRLDNDGIDGDARAALRIKATQSAVQFRLRAVNLDASSTYHLGINEVIVDTGLSDASGYLEFNGLPGGVPDVLDIEHIALLNSSSNSVLSTTLP